MNNANKSIFSLFEDVCQKFPDNIAIRHGNVSITYRELRLAILSVSTILGKHEKPIGIRCQNPINAITSMMACLLNKIIFIPLSPDWPIGRIQAICKNANSDSVIVDSCFQTTTLSTINIEHLSLETTSVGKSIKTLPSNDGIAYILFTSGTTGTPKGVAQSESALRQHVLHYIASIKAESHDRIIMVASFGYDAALMDVFASLLTGATLYPLTILDHSTLNLRQIICSELITVFHSTPSVFRLIFGEETEQNTYENLRVVVLGGEVARRADLKLFNLLCSTEAILINGYGPSESTLAMQAHFSHGVQAFHNSLPIGIPVPEVRVDLVNIETTAEGEVGEIVLLGPNVFMGYIQSPSDIVKLKQTRRKVEHHTGDLALRLSNGHLLYLGRKDNQIKISGVRIELEEINSLLVDIVGVDDVVTCVVERDNDSKHLVSYVRLPDGELQEDYVRESLGEKLPQAAIPSRIVSVDSFTYLPNGKIDFSALPKLNHIIDQKQDIDIFSQTILDIWRVDLGLDHPIHLEDRFIDIGGSSLKAISVISRIQKGIGIRVRPSALLQNPTLREFVALVKKGAEHAV
ncbi:acyl-CoA synthetase (AMP-forming)/AMP-acid ligase II [Advenella incenata]|uniref:Acyl-CoA synthetase (AMP-forming)/AMP-acid ligase II n=1 Tax=Advenella incenata TaxID=267800 RepID=A0A4Q7VS04_9BURK|nr:non-ribosomal peptide synthetase [Advenella incenata]RZT99028.1 acyl-CoA synthetase (AMP-forming)/AMP-acid ligase II [Advenella incenata]